MDFKSTARSPGGGVWLRSGLALGGALLTQELAQYWGRHLKPTDFYPLSLAIGMSLYNWHLIRVRPPQDDRSRLRAIWSPEQKRQALWVCLGLVILSFSYLGTRLSRPIKSLVFDDIHQLRPISRGLHTVSGIPQQDKQYYRWAFAGVHDTSDAPYLTPLREFKGQVLVISDQPLTEALTDQRGWLTEVSPLSQTHYESYRRYMGLSAEAPIYLFDLRGMWWLDPYGFAAALASILFFLITLGSATRDPHNQSRLLYIPPDLRDLNDSEVREAREEAQDATNEMTNEAVSSASRSLTDRGDELPEEQASGVNSELNLEAEVEPDLESEPEPDPDPDPDPNQRSEPDPDPNQHEVSGDA